MRPPWPDRGDATRAASPSSWPCPCAASIASRRTLPAEIAVLTEPLATCLHALSLIPEKFTETAVVLGGGTIGTLAAQLLRTAGTLRVIVSEPLVERHDEPPRRSPTSSSRPSELRDAVLELTGGVGADLSDRRGRDERARAPTRCACCGRAAARSGSACTRRRRRSRRSTSSCASSGSSARSPTPNAEFGRALGLLESGLLVPARLAQLGAAGRRATTSSGGCSTARSTAC